jgi:hypothetical protein
MEYRRTDDAGVATEEGRKKYIDSIWRVLLRSPVRHSYFLGGAIIKEGGREKDEWMDDVSVVCLSVCLSCLSAVRPKCDGWIDR